MTALADKTQIVKSAPRRKRHSARCEVCSLRLNGTTIVIEQEVKAHIAATGHSMIVRTMSEQTWGRV